jgi:hypothetical protein
MAKTKKAEKQQEKAKRGAARARFVDAEGRLRDGVTRAVRDAVGASRRPSEPFGDPASSRRHGELDLDPRDVARAIADVVPALVGREVRAAIVKEFDRRRGRVD